jgi:hypothetical protein
MSTFYLLPTRPQLGRHFAAFLRQWFPGLDWPGRAWPDLAEALTAAAEGRPDVYVVYREDLPDGEDPARALADGFGAEAGDEVIEVLAEDGTAVTARRWRLPGEGQPLAA